LGFLLILFDSAAYLNGVVPVVPKNISNNLDNALTTT